MPKRAKDSFAFSKKDPDGLETIVVVNADVWYDDNDPVVQAYPSNFIDIVEEIARQVQGNRPVEQATAAPGEKRNR